MKKTFFFQRSYLCQIFYLYDPRDSFDPSSEDFHRGLPAGPGPSSLQYACILLKALNRTSRGIFFDVSEWQTVVFKGPMFLNALSDDDTMFACMLLLYLLATGRDLNTFHGEDMSFIKERLIWWHTNAEVSGNGVLELIPLQFLLSDPRFLRSPHFVVRQRGIFFRGA